jgi:hypothetical protein
MSPIVAGHVLFQSRRLSVLYQIQMLAGSDFPVETWAWKPVKAFSRNKSIHLFRASMFSPV